MSPSELLKPETVYISLNTFHVRNQSPLSAALLSTSYRFRTFRRNAIHSRSRYDETKSK